MGTSAMARVDLGHKELPQRHLSTVLNYTKANGMSVPKVLDSTTDLCKAMMTDDADEIEIVTICLSRMFPDLLALGHRLRTRCKRPS
eukprot:4472048-Amphidinium_carterae.1